MRSTRRRLLLMLALSMTAISLLARPQPASAHPLGNFTVNTLSIVALSPEQVSVRFILDMAEIPTFQEMVSIDRNGDGAVSEEEQAAYLDIKAGEIERRLHLSINGSPLELSAVQYTLEFPPGQGGLSTLRMAVSLYADTPPLSAGQPYDLYFRSDSYAERTGLKDIVIKGADGIVLTGSTASQADTTSGLRVYPQDLLSSPPSLNEAKAVFKLAGAGHSGAARPAATASQSTASSDDILTSLLTNRSLSLPVMLLSFVTALGLGALHAASPGHGKTIMAAYLVGTRGTAKHAIFLGSIVTISHTMGVVGLGLVVLYASHLIAPERLYPWLSLASGLIIVGVGAWLLVTRLRASHHHHDEPEQADFLTRIRRIGAKVLHGHTHDHPHPHHHELPVDGSRLRMTWQSLTALGIVGGLVPSASALIILLAAISLQRVGFGLALILAFSAGMAAVLTGVGLALVYAGQVVERFQFRSNPAGTLKRLLPLATALVVLLSGLVVSVRAVFQVGLV